jgi:hypothetical protein
MVAGRDTMERNVMKRYFYTDPLAAAWMAKHFGMRFTEPDGEEVSLKFPGEGVSYWQRSYDNGYENYCGERFYIHPDSLPLLLPRPGDILIRAGIEEHVTMHNLFLFVHRAPDTEHLFKGFLQKGGMIIQRNGLPFHWPQSEQAP